MSITRNCWVAHRVQVVYAISERMQLYQVSATNKCSNEYPLRNAMQYKGASDATPLRIRNFGEVFQNCYPLILTSYNLAICKVVQRITSLHLLHVMCVWRCEDSRKRILYNQGAWSHCGLTKFQAAFDSEDEALMETVGRV
jgi:hypothetical protein